MVLRGCEGPRPDAMVASDPVAPSHFPSPLEKASRRLKRAGNAEDAEGDLPLALGQAGLIGNLSARQRREGVLLIPCALTSRYLFIPARIRGRRAPG